MLYSLRAPCMTQRSSAQLSNQSQDSLLILDLIQQISQSPVDSLGNSVGRPAERCQRKGPKLSGGPRAESCLTSCFGVDMAWSCARLTLEFSTKCYREQISWYLALIKMIGIQGLRLCPTESWPHGYQPSRMQSIHFGGLCCIRRRNLRASISMAFVHDVHSVAEITSPSCFM